LLRAQPQTSANPLLAGELPPDWNVGVLQPSVISQAAAALLPVARPVFAGQAAPASAYAAAVAPLNNLFGNMDAAGLNAHINRNFGKYIQHHSAVDKKQVEGSLQKFGLILPPYYWGKEQSAYARPLQLRNWYTQYHNVVAWVSSHSTQAAASQAKARPRLAALRPDAGWRQASPRPVFGNQFLPQTTTNPTGTTQDPGLCYDDNGFLVACGAGSGSGVVNGICTDSSGNVTSCAASSGGGTTWDGLFPFVLSTIGWMFNYGEVGEVGEIAEAAVSIGDVLEIIGGILVLIM